MVAVVVVLLSLRLCRAARDAPDFIERVFLLLVELPDKVVVVVVAEVGCAVAAAAVVVVVVAPATPALPEACCRTCFALVMRRRFGLPAPPPPPTPPWLLWLSLLAGEVNKTEDVW